MKRIIALIVCLMMVLAAMPALAAGELTITKSNLVVVDGSLFVSGYLYACVENTGDAPIACGDASMAIYDAAGEILETSDWVSTIPYNVILEPGEIAYIKEWVVFDDGITSADVGEYKLSIGEYEYTGNETNFIPCEVTVGDLSSDSYDNYIYVTFTCPEGDILYDIGVAGALYDADDNIIFAGYDTMSYVGLHPGSTVTVQLYVDSDIVEHMEANSIVPSVVEAYVYFEVE